MLLGRGTTMSSTHSNTLVTTVAALAAVAAVGIPLLQSDTVSRRFLSPALLQTKRHAAYTYKWNWTLIRAIIQSRKGRDQMHDRPHTELLATKTEVEKFIDNVLVNPKKKNDIRIVSMELDDEDARAKREYFIFLSNQSSGELYQLPLVLFGQVLADRMADQMTLNALLFIVDASSGLGTNVLSTMLEDSKAGVAVIREPLWMALFANIVEKQVISSTSLEQILFGLCRYEAWRVRDNVGAARTVAFTLPGQACTPALGPLLQSAFPCERHVFAYDACIPSVARALVRTNTNAPTNETASFHNSITATTPLTRTSLTKSIRGLSDALAKLPLNLAETTETWMSSVDTFFKLKADEAKNEYLPYVLKLSLMQGSLDEVDSDRRLALTNVLQFMTGSRSRPIPDAVLDAAVESLRDFCSKEQQAPSISSSNRKTIEECVFCHKSILIQDKTLLDTVLPRKEWSLKAAKKISGCACCGPDDDEEQDMLGNGTSNVDTNLPGAFAATTKSRPKYVDGKAAFAFDPTKFG